MKAAQMGFSASPGFELSPDACSGSKAAATSTGKGTGGIEHVSKQRPPFMTNQPNKQKRGGLLSKLLSCLKEPAALPDATCGATAASVVAPLTSLGDKESSEDQVHPQVVIEPLKHHTLTSPQYSADTLDRYASKDQSVGSTGTCLPQPTSTSTRQPGGPMSIAISEVLEVDEKLLDDGTGCLSLDATTLLASGASFPKLSFPKLSGSFGCAVTDSLVEDHLKPWARSNAVSRHLCNRRASVLLGQDSCGLSNSPEDSMFQSRSTPYTKIDTPPTSHSTASCQLSRKASPNTKTDNTLTSHSPAGNQLSHQQSSPYMKAYDTLTSPVPASYQTSSPPVDIPSGRQQAPRTRRQLTYSRSMINIKSETLKYEGGGGGGDSERIKGVPLAQVARRAELSRSQRVHQEVVSRKASSCNTKTQGSFVTPHADPFLVDTLYMTFRDSPEHSASLIPFCHKVGNALQQSMMLHFGTPSEIRTLTRHKSSAVSSDSHGAAARAMPSTESALVGRSSHLCPGLPAVSDLVSSQNMPRMQGATVSHHLINTRANMLLGAPASPTIVGRSRSQLGLDSSRLFARSSLPFDSMTMGVVIDGRSFSSRALPKVHSNIRLQSPSASYHYSSAQTSIPIPQIKSQS